MKNYSSVNKAISVLNCFSPDNLKLSASDIARKVDIHRATSYRLLEVLTRGGLIAKDGSTGKYSVGPALYMLGSLYLSSQSTFITAEPVVKEINNLTGEVVALSLFDKGYITLIMREESKHHLRLHYKIGTVFPAYANATGKASLAELSDEEIDQFYPQENLQPLTPKTVATKSELRRELEAVRKNGYAIVKEQAQEGACSVASVIRDASGQATAAMSIAIPLLKLNNSKLYVFANLVKLATALVSYRLGYADRNNPARDIEGIRDWWEKNRVG